VGTRLLPQVTASEGPPHPPDARLAPWEPNYLRGKLTFAPWEPDYLRGKLIPKARRTPQMPDLHRGNPTAFGGARLLSWESDSEGPPHDPDASLAPWEPDYFHGNPKRGNPTCTVGTRLLSWESDSEGPPHPPDASLAPWEPDYFRK
jgi:hypothetical protein